MNESALFKGAILPSAILAAISVAMSTILRGRPGFIGALLASVIVIIFFTVHLLVARMTREADPILTMALAIFSYFAKLILIGVFLFLITKHTDPSTVDRGSFAICAILITIAWLFGEIRSFLKLQLQLPLPRQKGRE